ncbi:hypothetical protein [Rhodanobacter sp. L36]|uniref:hypothetical protein n=1 Tax=Rhodanobacter sp. L36 TaxID=1747221 RepID=UPI00131BDC34|nr:hypothetical protein [Rhodanobacter sp. L36]
MSLNPQSYADAASDAYTDRPSSDIDNAHKPIFLNGQRYLVFGYKENLASGFHATAYENVKTHEIIIAYRGTDTDFKNHLPTMLKDVAVDYTMVRDRVNPQVDEAKAFAAEMMEKAQKQGISTDQVTLAGHSLGGTLVEIVAAEFHLRGTSINGYGAVDLNYPVPEGGDMVTTYVMAGDPVSAASRHYGQVVPLASDLDIEHLRKGRYLDAPPGAPGPNPLMAMRVDDHGVNTNFSGPKSMLKAENIEHALENHAKYKGAIEHFRSDLYNSRAELAVALNSTDHPNLESVYAHLSPHMQQQLAEYHASVVDEKIQNAVEHSQLIEDATHKLDLTSAAFQSRGESARQAADQVAQGFRAAGQTAQQQADQVSRGAMAFVEVDPVAAGAVALVTQGVGHVVRAEADKYALASHVSGQAAYVVNQLAAEQAQMDKRGINQAAHVTGRVATTAVHGYEAMAVKEVDQSLDTFHNGEKAAHAIHDTTTYLHDAAIQAGQAMSHGIDEVKRDISRAYDTLTHSEPWPHQGEISVPTQLPSPSTPLVPDTRGVTPADFDHANNDPRHPNSPQHALFNHLKEQIPEAGDNRLLQFTAACHDKGITEKNLESVHLNEQNHTAVFVSGGLTPHVTAIDLSQPSPQPAHSIQQIQQADQQQVQVQVQVQANIQTQTAQTHAQIPQGR